MRNPSSLFGRFPFYLALLIFSLAGIVSVTGKGTHGNRSTHHHDGITETYFWDFENRLTGLEKPGTGSYSYIYDHRTRRVVRDESGAGGDEAILSFSGGTSVQEWSNSLLVSEQIRGSDWGGGVGGVLYTIRNNQRSYNSYNSRGDVVSASDQTGTATWQASYEAFGRRTQEEGTNAERQRANTKDEDPTGLLNEGFRYRDLETGVFISRDPAGFVDGPNVYTYVKQNPWTMFDLDGLRAVGGVSSYKGPKHVPSTAEKIILGVYSAVLAPAMGPAVAVATPQQTGSAIAAQAQTDYAASGTLGVVNRFNPVTQAAGDIMGADLITGAPLTTQQRAENVAGGLLGTVGVASGGAAVAGKIGAATAREIVEGVGQQVVKGEPARMPALPVGEAPYQLNLFPDEAYSRTGHYGNTPTAAQRASVPPGMEFDHNPTLVKHYYEGDGAGGLPGFNLTQTERLQHARSVSSGSAATPAQQRSQGAAAAAYSKQQKEASGL